jgi:hypothetical protein
VEAPTGEAVSTPQPAGPAKAGAQRINANFGDKVNLLGAQFQPARVSPSEPMAVALYFQVTQTMSDDDTIFVHVVDAQSGQQLVNLDHTPSSGPTSAWRTGETRQDQFQVTLPPGTTAQQVFLGVGLWNAKTDKRLELKNPQAVRNDGNNRVFLGPIPVSAM